MCVCYLVNIAQPFADVLKALGVGDVIDQHDAHGSSVVGGGDGVEPFLARCVPAETQTVTASHTHTDACVRAGTYANERIYSCLFHFLLIGPDDAQAWLPSPQAAPERSVSADRGLCLQHTHTHARQSLPQHNLFQFGRR